MTSGAEVITEEPLTDGLPETGWFVYGVTRSDSTLPDDLTGLDGEVVRSVASGRVAAVITRVRIERPPGRGADLLAYNSVLDALAHQPGVVLPVRFGSVLPDEESAVVDFLAPDEEYFVDLLTSLEGRQQYMLQALYDEAQILAEVVEHEPEIARLRERTRDLPDDVGYGDRVRLGELVAAAVDQRRTADAEWLLEAVLPWADSHVARPVSGLERVLDVALLVQRERRQQFEERLEELAQDVHGRLRLRLMGPTAPYDFSGGL